MGFRGAWQVTRVNARLNLMCIIWSKSRGLVRGMLKLRHCSEMWWVDLEFPQFTLIPTA